MSVRLIDFLDIAKLRKYRHGLVPLDTARFLTRGKMLNLPTIFPALDPGQDFATGISEQNGDSLLGQVTLTAGSNVASLAFLSPEDSPSNLQLEMIEFLITQAGNWGCFSLQADVPENSPLFKILRQEGFSIYAWQRVWKLNGADLPQVAGAWEKPRDDEIINIQSLYSQIVPAMLQSIESIPRKADGLVCKQGEDLQAHITLTFGPAGIWAKPLIHPDAECLPEWMNSLGASIPNSHRKPVYLCVRSYQAWLESMLEEQGATAGDRQAVMVRHLTSRKVLEIETLKNKNAEPAWAKPAATINHYQQRNSDSSRNE
jgi:hypothetical protein